MKKKNIITLVAVAVVGLAAFLIATWKSSDTLEQDFHIEDIDAISKIYIADKQDNHVLLQRVADSTADVQWTVDTLYPASQPMINLLLSTLHDMRIASR